MVASTKAVLETLLRMNSSSSTSSTSFTGSTKPGLTGTWLGAKVVSCGVSLAMSSRTRLR